MVYSILGHLLLELPGKGNLIKPISYSLLYRKVHMCSLGRVPNAVVFRSAHNLPESFLKSRGSKFHGIGPCSCTDCTVLLHEIISSGHAPFSGTMSP